MSEKELTRDQYLQALALFTMASNHMRKAEEFEKGLAEILGADERGYMDQVSDAIYSTDRSFNDALKLYGFIIPEGVS